MALRHRNKATTREEILAAARTVVNRDGAGRLSTRSVAAEAGVNQSLIHYHFGTREGLLLAVVEQMNLELIQRQRRMYSRPDMTLADKWQQAIDYYRVDLASGYVRTLMELAAHGYTSRTVSAKVRVLFNEWRGLLSEVAAEAVEELGVTEMTADEIVAALAAYWWGMEMQHVLGVPESESPLWATTAAFGRLIGAFEERRQAQR